MGKFARSARGVLVDFDFLEITQTLKSVPQPVSVDHRRQFINDKDGVSTKKAQVAGAVAAKAMEISMVSAAESIQAEEIDTTPLSEITIDNEEVLSEEIKE